MLSNPANYPRKTPCHLHCYPTLLNTPSKIPFQLHSLSNPAWQPKKNPFHWHCYPLLATSQGQFHSTCIPPAFHLHSTCIVQSCVTLHEKFHSTCLVIQFCSILKEKSILPALLFNPALLSKENIPFHLPCNLVLLYMYTPRKISFLLDWYLIRSPFHLHYYPLLQQRFISSVIQWCSGISFSAKGQWTASYRFTVMYFKGGIHLIGSGFSLAHQTALPQKIVIWYTALNIPVVHVSYLGGCWWVQDHYLWTTATWFLHSGYFVSTPVCSHWTFSGVQFKVLWVEFLILSGCMLIQKRQQPLTQFEFFCKNIIALFPGVGKYGNQLNEFV